MNPYGDTTLNSGSQSPPPSSPPDPSYDPPPAAMLPSPQIIQTSQNLETDLSFHGPSEQGGVQNEVDRSVSPPPASDLVLSLASSLSENTSPLNPYLVPSTPPSCQISVIIPSPDLHPTPLHPQCCDDSSPDLECSICFSQFNNVFRCPKMLQCKHTFCLECLARINVKSTQPNAIQCPLCRSFTPLPDLGLPKLTTDSDVLSYLPAAMQRVYSIRFHRNKGKLQVKRSSDGNNRWGQRSLTSLRSTNRSLDVGLPSPPAGGHSGRETGGCGEALFRLTGRPACRTFLLTSVVMMLMLLTGIVIFLLTYDMDPGSK
ncbi:E3 ubiquitin-protein ligase rnf152 [Notolabrus celidotus]|uniref:E3 ubiquitin-protein ligase rnf152 n=1 Tax=Notolabrus celidotus TaxID=1203425 RepID=UPI0014906325|nr:E3 ubiquitin-protein ligase rnf152 [Notolabrus celidotus]